MSSTSAAGKMANLEISIPSQALLFLRGYAVAKGTTVSDYISSRIAEWIEDEEDNELALKALAEYEADPTVYTPEEAHAYWERKDKERTSDAVQN